MLRKLRSSRIDKISHAPSNEVYLDCNIKKVIKVTTAMIISQSLELVSEVGVYISDFFRRVSFSRKLYF